MPYILFRHTTKVHDDIANNIMYNMKLDLVVEVRFSYAIYLARIWLIIIERIYRTNLSMKALYINVMYNMPFVCHRHL